MIQETFLKERMKSPTRPGVPLRDRNHRNMILKDRSYLMQKEVNERRQIRVKQARERANEVARVVRQRTEREKIRLVTFLTNLIKSKLK